MIRENDYWKGRFRKTLGYALKGSYTSRDIMNCRLESGYSLSKDLESSLSKVGRVDIEMFWAYVVVPETDLINVESYINQGRERRDVAAMEALGGKFGEIEDKKELIKYLESRDYHTSGKRDPLGAKRLDSPALRGKTKVERTDESLDDILSDMIGRDDF